MNLTNINNSKVFQSISDTVFYLQLKPSTTHFISHVWWTLSPSPRPTDWYTETFFLSRASCFLPCQLLSHPTSRASFCFLGQGGEKAGLRMPESRQALQVDAALYPGLVNLVVFRHTGFSGARILLLIIRWLLPSPL